VQYNVFYGIKNRINILVVTIVGTIILSLPLVACLTLVSSQQRAVLGSLAWASALPIVEAGLEEGLTRINTAKLDQLASDDWIAEQTSLGLAYVKVGYLGDDHYEVWILPAEPPLIYSTAFVRVPSAALEEPGNPLQLSDSSRPEPSNAPYMIRRVRLQTRLVRTTQIRSPLSSDRDTDSLGLYVLDSWSEVGTGPSVPELIASDAARRHW
jgi:hypothetical protein